MFLPINSVPFLTTGVIEVEKKGYNGTFVHFQTSGNQQSEKKSNTCNFLEILA